MDLITNSQKWILRNKAYHNKIADAYASQHSEIYNPIEQRRLATELEKAISILKLKNPKPIALDVGAGAGNLTNHLLDLGCNVVAADIASNFLKELERKFSVFGESFKTDLLNGTDLSNWANNYFDFCGCYSVLHHVPDYLALINEMARVIRPGGIIYIDHESSPEAWAPPKAGLQYLSEFRAANKPSFFARWGPSGLRNRIVLKLHKLRDPRYQPEGDIHIWPDDHIEWDLIAEHLQQAGFTNIERHDYLVCREGTHEAPLYSKYLGLYKDMSMLIAVKRI